MATSHPHHLRRRFSVDIAALIARRSRIRTNFIIEANGHVMVDQDQPSERAAGGPVNAAVRCSGSHAPSWGSVVGTPLAIMWLATKEA